MIVKRRTPIHLEWPYQIFRRRVVSGRRAVADAVDDQKLPDNSTQCCRYRQNHLHVFVSSFFYVVIENLVDSMVVIFIITALERNCFLVVVKSFCPNAILSDLYISLLFDLMLWRLITVFIISYNYRRIAYGNSKSSFNVLSKGFLKSQK